MHITIIILIFFVIGRDISYVCASNCDLTGTWTAILNDPGMGNKSARKLHHVQYEDLTSEQFYILANPKNKTKLIFQAITDQGTGWNLEDGAWDDYTSDPGSGA